DLVLPYALPLAGGDLLDTARHRRRDGGLLVHGRSDPPRDVQSHRKVVEHGVRDPHLHRPSRGLGGFPRATAREDRHQQDPGPLPSSQSFPPTNRSRLARSVPQNTHVSSRATPESRSARSLSSRRRRSSRPARYAMSASSAASRAAGSVAASSASSRCRAASVRFHAATISASSERTSRERSAAARSRSALVTAIVARAPTGIVRPRETCLSVPSTVGSFTSTPPSSVSAGSPPRLAFSIRDSAARPRASAARTSAALAAPAPRGARHGGGAGAGRSPAAARSVPGSTPTRNARAAAAARRSAAAVKTSARADAASACVRTTSRRGTRPAS